MTNSEKTNFPQTGGEDRGSESRQPSEKSAESGMPSGMATAIVAVAIVAGLLIYVLSIGPIGLLFDSLGWPMEPLQMVYAPVIWLHEHTFLREPLEWYVELFGV